ncbi:hypothetical protein GALMADRAFT_302726 [Galerina marginata CBS 339.88]|uniref:REJ domain-containing protein n=1 Tax=Galerina marginata (strain CBS 339.88) TaxID=685588 RepID=A0A067TP49_GALM3|nr:hypothetical protein GALMADRAFT_302726 [Galerina marginata CBS 339.88]
MPTSLALPSEPPVKASQSNSPLGADLASTSSSSMPSSSAHPPAPPPSSHSISTKANTASPTSSHNPAPPPSKTSSSSTSSHTSSSTSHSTSTTTSVTVTRIPTTSTVTTHASTTLSSALAFTSSGANGAKIITTPPLVTLLSTSTEPNGALTTVTNVVANPPSFNSSQELSSNTGIHKPGVLAGVCIVAGIAIASLLAGIVFCIRRSRRRLRQRRWLAGMQQQRPSSSAGDPFQDPHTEAYEAGGPAMRSVDTSRDDVRWNRSNNSPVLQEPMSHEQRNFGTGMVSLYPDPYPVFYPGNPGRQEGHELQRVGLGYSNDLAVPIAPFRRHSPAPSTPSVYPATLPPDEEEHHEAQYDMSRLPPKEQLPTVPPRPPRSHLRESAKMLNYAPLTPPPSSNSSHSTSQPPSPISETRPQDLLTRRTLLDIRSRAIS